jgi:phosphatidylserine decarboxylase
MIAREGLLIIGSGVVLALILLVVALKVDSWWLWTLTAILTVLTLFTVFFFRDPDRHIDPQERLIVAPADGKIVAVKEIGDNDFIGGPAVRISIFLSVFDVHVNRNPASGVVNYVKYNPGKFLAAFEEKASLDNEQTEIGMTTPDGKKLIFKQIAGLIARRIVCKLSDGDTIKIGNRMGMIRFGSRADVIVSAHSEVKVAVGNRVRAGETVLGFLPGPAMANSPQVNKGENVEL